MNQMTNLPVSAPAITASNKSFRADDVSINAERPLLLWQAPEPTPDLVEVWRALLLRKWSILTLGMLTAGVAAFVVAQIAPTFQSTATVLIEAAPAKVMSQIEDVYSGVSNNREHFQTQAEVMKSRDVAVRVIQKLSLTTHSEFDPRQRVISAPRQWLQSALPSADALFFPHVNALHDDGVTEYVLREYAKRLTVEPIRLSQLLRVRFEATDPLLAAAVANAVGEAYISLDRENRVNLTAGAGNWIRERMTELKRKLETSERALQAYRDKEGLLDSKTTVLGGTGKQLDELTNRLVEAGVRRSMAEEAFKQIKGSEGNLDSVPAIVRSPSVQNAKTIENEVEKKLAEISQRYGPDHPRNVAARSELQSAKSNTQREIRTIVDSITKEYQAAAATEKSLEAQLKESKGTIQSLNRKEIQLNSMEREAATNRQLYEAFLTRYGETTATRDSQAPNARIIDRATPSISPIRPKPLTTVTLALISGFLGGAIVALIIARLNNTIKATSDVESKLSHPFLAALPTIGMLHRKSAARIVVDRPHDLYAEGIRTASTGLILSAMDVPRKILAVTSSFPGEGKSTFAVNLALTQSKSRTVLLVEADLRRPSIGKMLALPAEHPGLSSVLADEAAFDQAVQRIEGSDLSILTAGHAPPDPLDLLSSKRFGDLISELREQYELIIIDCPPVQLVSDALIVARRATGVVYVVKSDDTPVPSAKTGIKRIVESGSRVIGVVLNQHNFKRAERYYGEAYGYGRYGAKAYGYAKK